MSGKANDLNKKFLIPGGATVNSENVFTISIDSEKYNFTLINNYICPAYGQIDFMKMFSMQRSRFHQPNYYLLATNVSGQLSSQHEKLIRLLSAQDSGINGKGQITDPEKFASLNCSPVQISDHKQRIRLRDLKMGPITTKAHTKALDTLRVWFEKFTGLNMNEVMQDEMSNLDDFHLLDDLKRDLHHNETENGQKSEDLSFLDDLTHYMDQVETERETTKVAFDDSSLFDDLTLNMDQVETESEKTNVAFDDITLNMDQVDTERDKTKATSKLRGARQIRPNIVTPDDLSFLDDLIRLMDRSDTENEKASVPSKLRGARQRGPNKVASDDLSFLDDLIRLMDRSDTGNDNTSVPSKLRGARQRRPNTNTWFAFCLVFGQRIEIHGLDSEHQAHLVYDYLQEKMGRTKHNFPNESLPQHVKTKVDYKFNELNKKDSIRSEHGHIEHERRKKLTELSQKYAHSWAAECIINGKSFKVYGFSTEHDAHLAYDYIQEKLGRKKVNYPNESLSETFRILVDKKFEQFIANNNIKLVPKQILDLDLDELTKGLDQDDLLHDGQVPDSNDSNKSFSWAAQCIINSKSFKVYGFSTEHDAHLAYDYIQEKLGRKKVNYPNESLSETFRIKVDKLFEKFIARHNIKHGPNQALDLDMDEFMKGLDQDDLFHDGQDPNSNDSNRPLKRPRSP